MRIPLTKYGWPEVIFLPASMLVLMAVICVTTWIGLLSLWLFVLVELVLAFVLLWSLLFFRDPHRAVVGDRDILLAPADGRVTNIEVVDEQDFIGEPALLIGIFLSIFDVHINRAPCDVKVERITYRKGRFKNAMNPRSGHVNESNDLALVRTDNPHDRLIVRQISGAIAQRIVCRTSEGQELAGGEKFGMIKFGSRTELYVPARDSVKSLVQIGDKVKAGLTPLVRYE